MTLLPEWAPQDAIQLAWPHSHSDWAPWLPDATQLYVTLCRMVSQYQQLLIAVDPTVDLATVKAQCEAVGCIMDNIHWQLIPTNDTWARDHGPITVSRQGELQCLDFQFNGWGNKFSWQKDNNISRQIAQANMFAAPLVQQDLVLEGGSIEWDGQGTLMTTKKCLLNPNRNPTLSAEQIENALIEAFNAEQILWLTHGDLLGDDTDAHIDTLARFCSPNHIAYVKCFDETDVHFPELQAMEAELTKARNFQGQAYQLVPLPLPPARFNQENDRLPLTYANFLITNQQVIVPIYGCETDQQALDQLVPVFPDRKVVGLDCSVLVEQFGSLHCITMQLPKGVLA